MNTAWPISLIFIDPITLMLWRAKSWIVKFHSGTILKIHYNIIPHFHTGLQNELFPSRFQSKISSKLFSLLCMPNSLLILWLFFDTPASDKHCKLWNSRKCILFCPVPLSSVQTLFPPLCSQTQPAYKWQEALPSLKSPFSCYSFHTYFSIHILTNKMK